MIEEVVGDKERSTTFVTRAAAEEKELRSYNAEKVPEILHIATHGFFLKEQERLAKRIMGMQRGSQNPIPPPADNPLLRAGLAFAGLNPNAPLLGEIDTDNDGVLTAMEVLSLNLTGTRLVILSACETGLGEVHEGEGVYGLRRSFQEAGVDSVINSFWEVSDDGTQLLMTKFYDKYLDGIPPREAMREARLEMVEDFRWSSPFFGVLSLWSVVANVITSSRKIFTPVSLLPVGSSGSCHHLLQFIHPATKGQKLAQNVAGNRQSSDCLKASLNHHLES